MTARRDPRRTAPWHHVQPGRARTAGEDRLRLMAFGAAAVWAAFYVSMQAQLVWYAITQPWSASPRPF
jgi:hypothetical protein